MSKNLAANLDDSDGSEDIPIAVGLPSYDASVSESPAQGQDRRAYKDDPDSKQASARSYSSEQVGPSYSGPMKQSRLQNLFSGWGSRSSASTSLRELYADVIRRPSEATADVFSTILETCKRGDIQLDQITTNMDGHRPIFWMIVHDKKMPGTIQTFLQQTHRLTSMTPKDIQDARAACLVHDALDLYRQIVAKESELTNAVAPGLQTGDAIDIIKTEPPVLGFIANITLQDFVTRYRTTQHVDISFPARHREWHFRLGTTSIPKELTWRDRTIDRSTRGAQLILVSGESLPCLARIRLRHPTHAVESDWLKLGTLVVVKEDMASARVRRGIVAFCGPSALNRNKDWQALEFGEGQFLDAAGSLTLQLQVVATTSADQQRPECVIQ